ncbi:UPF0149 family protein [Novosphingobium resinovorum]|uniref:UPF0149 family protein n=1 Tax=Novosphingobium resinovorum TaxID=158500 RepID=UPI002ED02C41|nr:UPF0149 family protein [Novosphingobium resinovorum]
MNRFPSRFRRLDGILADLAVDDPLLLTELDGYLTGIAAGPQAIAPDEWLPPIWGGAYGEPAPFEEPSDVPLFTDMVIARYEEILRDLRRGKPQPIFDIDERNGEVLWEEWTGGVAMAMALRPAEWDALAEAQEIDAGAALRDMLTLMAVARDESGLDAGEINALCDAAVRTIPELIARIHAFKAAQAGAPMQPPRPIKIGRNDPCPCGSGKKHKRCCG